MPAINIEKIAIHWKFELVLGTFPCCIIHISFFFSDERAEPKCYMCDDVIEPENCRTTGYCDIDEVIS